MTRLDVVAVGELNPDLILGGLSGPPRLGREILAGHCTFTLGSSTALCTANLAALGLSAQGYDVIRNGQTIVKWPAGTVPIQLKLGTSRTLTDGTNFSTSAQAANL